MLVGAGTVIGAGRVEDAVEAGAKFIVSPGLSEEVVKKCRAGCDLSSWLRDSQ